MKNFDYGCAYLRPQSRVWYGIGGQLLYGKIAHNNAIIILAQNVLQNWSNSYSKKLTAPE